MFAICSYYEFEKNKIYEAFLVTENNESSHVVSLSFQVSMERIHITFLC